PKTTLQLSERLLLSLSSRKLSPLYRACVRKHLFATTPPGFRYGSAIAIPPFISGQPHSRLFFTFLPGCYAGEGGALFS
ncbi:hypothetical protein, partial [Escherichia coli]|uniref:hypothetical protein n=1 Tax=Escherichia coli TaxID=562 RepID=UPI00207CC02E